MPPSKFEVDLMLRLRVTLASFSLFPLASSYSNAYFCVYEIIYFLADQLVFLNTVTSTKMSMNLQQLCSLLSFTIVVVVVVVGNPIRYRWVT